MFNLQLTDKEMKSLLYFTSFCLHSLLDSDDDYVLNCPETKEVMRDTFLINARLLDVILDTKTQSYDSAVKFLTINCPDYIPEFKPVSDDIGVVPLDSDQLDRIRKMGYKF